MEDECGDCTLMFRCLSDRGASYKAATHAQRCIAFLTQTKTPIPEEFRAKIGNRVYGCDTCQTVCPKNRKKHNLHQRAFHPVQN